ncbi:unnamed protein product [Anisakis simplex]|uniref:Tyrosine-protein kinase n=1 Tax=Anisakis simplex TaxID=6269 RepID=A0A0M3JYG3_ANISI|nr:unnamed protein product [Anisakis simplex]
MPRSTSYDEKLAKSRVKTQKSKSLSIEHSANGSSKGRGGAGKCTRSRARSKASRDSLKTNKKLDPAALKKKEEEFAKVDNFDVPKAGNALQMNEWYHGLMPREEIEEMLHADGDFIVRRTEVGGKTRLVVSVMNKKRIRHILLMLSDGQWSLRNLKMRSITSLILEHVKQKIPVQADGTLLQKPVSRPEYYILHDHVQVKDQIGAGAFGDVYIGVLTKNDGTKVDVAIKQLKGLMTKRQRSIFMKILSKETPMALPEGTPETVVKVMGLCFTQEPTDRPNFVDILKILSPNEKPPEGEHHVEHLFNDPYQ